MEPATGSTRPKLWLYVVGLVALLLILASIVIAVLKYHPSPVPTVTNFTEDLVAAQYDAAYMQTSTSFQAHQSLAQFTKAESSLTDITGVVSDVTTQAKLSQTTDSVGGQVRYSSNHTDRFTADVIWVDRRWQINNFTVAGEQ